MSALYFAAGALTSTSLMNIHADPRWFVMLVPAAACIIAAAVMEESRREE